jgi:hypothetical protein
LILDAAFGAFAELFAMVIFQQPVGNSGRCRRIGRGGGSGAVFAFTSSVVGFVCFAFMAWPCWWGELTAVLQGDRDVKAARHRRFDDLLEDGAASAGWRRTCARCNGGFKWLGYVTGFGHDSPDVKKPE